MTSRLKTLVYVCIAGCMISACAGTAVTPSTEDIRPGAEAVSGPTIPGGNGIAVFPHLPVPFELEKIGSETVIFTTPEFHGGVFTLKGSVSKESVMDFFLRRLPEEGWRPAGRLESQTGYMAFINSRGGSCFMQISSINMGFGTKVRIYVSEGMRQDNVIQ